MSLNKFFNTNTGLDIDLRIGADEVKANNMETNNIDVTTINGSPYPPGGGGVTNPLTSDLILDGYKIKEEATSVSPSLNIDQEDPTKEIKLSVGNSDIRLRQNVFNGIKIVEIDPIKQIQIGTDDGANDSNIRCSANGTQFDKTIEMNANLNDNGGGIRIIGDGLQHFADVRATKLTGDGVYEKSGGSQSLALTAANIEVLKDMDMNNNSINSCNNLIVSSINNISPIGGLSTGVSNSALLTTSTTEQSILPLTFLGSRIVPPNTFKQGDAYYTTCSGSFSSNNGDTLTIRLKSGLTTLSTFVIPLNASSGVFYQLAVNFSIRQIGTAGVAQLVSSFEFTYNQSAGGNFQGIRDVSINSTNFNTTITNDLDVTAQFSSASASNSIQTIHSVLYKTY